MSFEEVPKDKIIVETPDKKKKLELSKEEFEQIDQINIFYRGRKYQVRVTTNGKLLMS